MRIHLTILANIPSNNDGMSSLSVTTSLMGLVMVMVNSDGHKTSSACNLINSSLKERNTFTYTQSHIHTHTHTTHTHTHTHIYTHMAAAIGIIIVI